MNPLLTMPESEVVALFQQGMSRPRFMRLCRDFRFDPVDDVLGHVAEKLLSTKPNKPNKPIRNLQAWVNTSLDRHLMRFGKKERELQLIQMEETNDDSD